MFIEISEEFENNITRLAKTANLTSGEIIELTFKNSQFLKTNLLYEKEHFSDFIDEYHSVLNTLDNFETELLTSVKETTDSYAIQQVFKELFRLSSEDIWLLNKLFQVYKQSESITKLL